MTARSTDDLVSAYLADRNWDDRRKPGERTASIIQDLTEALIDSGQIGTQELTALYRLCMNSDTYPVSSKRGEVDELEIPADVKQSVKQRLDEPVGTVGGLLFPVEVPDDEKEAVTSCLGTVLRSDESDELDEAVQRLASLDLPKVECGKLSPILHYLQPEYFPVVNNLSRNGMTEYFDQPVSNALADYPETAATYRSIRDTHGFNPNFRDLDYFFVWVNQQAKTKPKPSLEGDRAYFWVNQGNQAEIRDEYLRAKVDDVWHHDLEQLSSGDVIFHNYDDELIGLSVVEGDTETYEFRGEKYQRVSVDFQWFDEAVPVDEELKEALNDAELRRKYYPIDTNGNLNQTYLSKLSLEAAEFLLDRVEGWNVIQSVENYRDDEETVPDKPDGVEDIERQLQSKKQVVFYGPPGTGKTYTAERFAKWWAGQQDVSLPVSDRVETVTFHPSFTYEDFVEGLSAKTDSDGQVAYEVEDGALKRIREAAIAAYEEASAAGTEPPRYVLIIDEINRGNLAQIFGELITLLEADKRGTFTVDLAHSGETVTLPPNLYVIGTMNTADQSIALVDTALRRRFRFIDFPPDLEIVWGEEDTVTSDAYAAVTQRDKNTSRREQLLGASVLAVRELNDRILRAPDLGKGKQLGHTYLLGHTSTIEIVDAWRYDILPQLEEYYFGQFDRFRDELLTETGERLIQWDEEQIQSFSAQDLYTALCDVAGIDDPAPLTASAAQVIADGSDGQIDAVDAWDTGEKTVDAFRERVERKLDPEAYQRVERLLTVGEEVGWVDTGRGDTYATAQLKSDAVDPGVGVLQLNQDGQIDFRWNWLVGRDENDLTGEFVNDTARIFEEIEAYSQDWRPDSEEDKDFIVPSIPIQDLSEDDMDVLINKLKTFIQRADEFQNG